MADTSTFPNYQDQAAGAIPVWNAAPPAGATAAPQGAPYNYTDLGYVQQAVGATSAALTTIPAGAKYAVITVEGAAIRYRLDGVAPTASVGNPAAIGAQITISTTLSGVRVIQQATGAVINIEYLK